MLLRSYLGSIASGASVAELDDYAATIDGLPGGPPLAHWRLGEGSGTQIVDRKAGARHGAYSGTIGHGAAGLPQNSDDAVDFAGTGYGEIPHDAGLALSAFSLSFWFQVSDYPSTEGNGREVIVSKDQVGLFLGDFAATVEDSGEFIAQFQTASAQHQIIGPIVALDVPHHVVVRADSSGFDAYLDGLYLGKNTNHTDAWASNTQPLRFGAAPWNVAPGSTWPNDPVLFDGILDEVALYDRVITEAEVLSLAQYDQAPTANEDDFVVPEAATTVLDVVGNDQYAGQKSALTVEVLSQPAFGTATARGDNDIDLAAGSVSQNEADSFSYRITDGFGHSDPATVNLTVQDAAAGGGGAGDDGLGGTLVFDWAPLGTWIDGVPLSDRDTNDIADQDRTDWWIDGDALGGGLVRGLSPTGINRLCWNRAPTGHPSLEIKTNSGSHAALGLRLQLYGRQETNPRHLRVVFEIKVCQPSDPTTYKPQGFDGNSNPYPNWSDTHAGISGKLFGGQWMGDQADGACRTNWYGDSSFPIGRGAHRTGWTSSKKPKAYAYAYGRSTACGESGALSGSRLITDPGIATGWFRLENEVRLTTPSLVNSTWGSFGTNPSGGDGFKNIFITPDIDQEVGVSAVRELRARVENRVFNTSMNNYHQTVSLTGVFLFLYYGGGDPAQASGWSWIRRIQVYHYPEDDI